MKQKNLYKAAVLCGLIPLVGGLFIFFTWWIARAYFAIDLKSFEEYGFIWLFGSFWVACLGLLLMLLFIVYNGKNHLTNFLFGVVIILINIPVALWVLDTQSTIGKRVYVKITNATKRDDIEITMEGRGYKQAFSLNDKESIVTYYIPYNFDRGYDVEPAKIIVKQASITQTDTLPKLWKGDCGRFYIDKELKLQVE